MIAWEPEAATEPHSWISLHLKKSGLPDVSLPTRHRSAVSGVSSSSSHSLILKKQKKMNCVLAFLLLFSAAMGLLWCVTMVMRLLWLQEAYELVMRERKREDSGSSLDRLTRSSKSVFFSVFVFFFLFWLGEVGGRGAETQGSQRPADLLPVLSFKPWTASPPWLS